MSFDSNCADQQLLMEFVRQMFEQHNKVHRGAKPVNHGLTLCMYKAPSGKRLSES